MNSQRSMPPLLHRYWPCFAVQPASSSNALPLCTSQIETFELLIQRSLKANCFESCLSRFNRRNMSPHNLIAALGFGCIQGSVCTRQCLVNRRVRKEPWVTSLLNARVVIEAWRREYNQERPKRSLGSLTPAAYEKKLIQKPVKLASDAKAKCY